MSDEALPCPFCDGTDTERRFIQQKFYAPNDIHQERARYKNVYFRFCNGCGCHGAQTENPDETDSMWNRRIPSVSTAELEAANRRLEMAEHVVDSVLAGRPDSAEVAARSYRRTFQSALISKATNGRGNER